MTSKEFNTLLEEGITNEMFESLVLYHIKDNYMITECNEQFESANERLYYKFTDKMIDRLLENKYIIETKDWNRKTGKIKLSGSSGKDRICKSHFHSGVGYVTFNIDKPYDHILQYLAEEKDIDVLVEKILKMLKNK